MKKNYILAILLCLLVQVFGCAPKKSVTLSRTVFAMDTVMTLTATGERAEEALSLAEAELFRLDSLLNRHLETSTISELNRTGCIKNAELAALISRALMLGKSTDGAFDCTLAPIIDLWDVSGDGHIPNADELSSVLCLTGAASRVNVSGDLITLTPGTVLDLGAIGKGYAGERIRAIYDQCGVTGCICLGGDNCLVGPKGPQSPLWRVGLLLPGSSDEIIGIITVTDTFTVTSGSYERFFIGEDGTVYHHILDPETGCPARSGLVSVTVLTQAGVDADALATAFFVMGAEKSKIWLADHPEVQVILVTEDNTVLYSASLAGIFLPESEAYVYETF